MNKKVDPTNGKNWQNLTIKKRKTALARRILQLEGQLATSITTQYDNESAVIGSNLAYAAIHQLGGQAGKGKKVSIPARPYLNLTESDYKKIIKKSAKYL